MKRYKLQRDLVGAKGLKYPAWFVVEPDEEQWPQRRIDNMVNKGFMQETDEPVTKMGKPEKEPAKPKEDDPGKGAKGDGKGKGK